MELMKYELSNSETDGMLIDEDYMGLMSDTLFSTITNHPFAFPDTREIGNLDCINNYSIIIHYVF